MGEKAAINIMMMLSIGLAWRDALAKDTVRNGNMDEFYILVTCVYSAPGKPEITWVTAIGQKMCL